MLGAACPVKPAPTGLRNAGLTILPEVERRPMLLTRRAGCHESGSSSSREALTSNPFPRLEGVIREFYPMAADVAEVGRRRRTSSRIARQVCEWTSSEAVAAKAGVTVQAMLARLNPVQGDRGQLARSTWLPWGVCIRRRMQPGHYQSRRPVEKTGGEKLNHERRESACE